MIFISDHYYFHCDIKIWSTVEEKRHESMKEQVCEDVW